MTVLYNVRSGQMEPTADSFKWCCPDCETLWQKHSTCEWCGRPGVRWDGKGPEGWPVLTTGPRERP